jgi:hypothetical protein
MLGGEYEVDHNVRHGGTFQGVVSNRGGGIGAPLRGSGGGYQVEGRPDPVAHETIGAHIGPRAENGPPIVPCGCLYACHALA